MKIKSLLLALLIAISSAFIGCEDEESEDHEPQVRVEAGEEVSSGEEVEESDMEVEEEEEAGEELPAGEETEEGDC